MEIENKKILVTGGAGFIGSHLLKYMVKKYPESEFHNLDALVFPNSRNSLVEVEDAPNYRLIEGTICDFEFVSSLVSANDYQCVVHLAAETHVDKSIVNPLKFVESNVLGTGNLLESVRRAWKSMEGKVFYHVSTDEVYGTTGDSGAFHECSPLRPNSPYAASKGGADLLVRSYHKTFGVPVLSSHCCNNYGSAQYPEKLVPVIVRKIVNQELIPVYGKGENMRSWLHVSDHVRAIETILLRGSSGSRYNVGTGDILTNLEMVGRIGRIVERELNRKSGSSDALVSFVEDRPGHDYRYAMDLKKIENELGWRAQISLDEGLTETVKWYLAHREYLLQSTHYSSD